MMLLYKQLCSYGLRPITVLAIMKAIKKKEFIFWEGRPDYEYFGRFVGIDIPIFCISNRNVFSWIGSAVKLASNWTHFWGVKLSSPELRLNIIKP